MDRSFCLFYFACVVFFQQTTAIRNTKRNDGNQYINSQNPISEWEHGLREAVYQTLHIQYKNPNLRNYLRAAPILGRQGHQVTPFGDIAVIARGQLYFSHLGFFFVQDPYQNDCDECHNPNPACIGEQCQTWRPPNDEKLIALWTVKRIRHRDSNGGFRYELKYIISLLGSRSNRVLLRRDGRFDYNIPGHVFILRSGVNGHHIQKNLRESHRIYTEDEEHPTPIFRSSLPAPPNYIHEYLPKNVQIPPHPHGHYPLTERTKSSTLYDTPNTGNQIDETPSAKESFTDRQVSNQVTNKPKNEEELYRELINILQQKTSTHSSLQNKDQDRRYFKGENRFPPGASLDKPPRFKMPHEIGLRNQHTTSPTYATHVKKMQDTISNSLSKPKETTPLLTLPTISREYSKTTMYSSTNAKDSDSALSTTQTLFSNPPPTVYTTVTSGTTSLPRPRPTNSENKKSKSQVKLSTRFGPLGNYPSSSPKTRFSSRYTAKVKTTPSTTTLSKTSKYGGETIRKIQPNFTKLQTTTSSKSSPELEIIPITDQNALLTPILDLLRPIMEIMKTENPFTHYHETSTAKTSRPPITSTLIQSNKQYTTTSLPKENKHVVTSSERTKQLPTVVEVQKSETKLETFEEIPPQINKTLATLVNTKTTNIPTGRTYTPINKKINETTTFSLKETTSGRHEETTTETSSTSKVTRSPTETTPYQTVSTILLSKEIIIELNTTEENSPSPLLQNNLSTVIPQSKTSPKIVSTTTKRPLLINRTKPNVNIPQKAREKNQNNNFVNDLFGSTKHITTTKKPPSSIEKLEESNVSILEELFGPRQKSTTASISSSSSKINDRMDYDISSIKSEENEEPDSQTEYDEVNDKSTEIKPTPKIIFSNFFFAPTKTPENVTIAEEQETQLKAVTKEPNNSKSMMSIEKMKMMAHYTMNEDQEEIPTSQSVSTSISYVITKPNRTKIANNQSKFESATMIKALVKEITNKHSDFVVYEAEFLDHNKTKTENDIETSAPDIKSFLNNITLSVVNHARAIDYVHAEKHENDDKVKKNKTKVQPSSKQLNRKGVIIKTA